MLTAWLLLAAPIAAALLAWGQGILPWAALATAAGEFLALRRTERFSERVWRVLRVGRRAREAHAAETAYLVLAVAGVALLVLAVIDRLA